MPLLLLLLLLDGHSASQGKSSFVVDKQGEGRVSVQLVELDLPELCDVDFGVSTAEKKRYMQEKLDVCVSKGMGDWLRLRVDAQACKISGGRWKSGEGFEIVLEADVRCPPPAGHNVTIDWGFFQASPLDHVSTSTITIGDVHKQALFSKRKNKLLVEVPGGALEAPAAAILVCVCAFFFFVVTAAVVFARRRARRAPQ